MPEAAVWLIFLLPLFSFVIISFIIRPFFNDRPRLAGYVTIASIAVSFVFALWALNSVRVQGELVFDPVEWVVIGNHTIKLGVMLDPLTAVMVVVVTLCSLMVQIYSQGYMHGDSGYCRYYAFMSLFTGSMLGLVLADNLIQLFVFWELVGLCSYLLIGFWFHKPSAAAAAKKAFIVTRIGDLGLLAAILVLFFRTEPGTAAHTLNISALYEAAPELAAMTSLGVSLMTLVAIGIFAGAVGKSAQFPLHVWLPDAMEGPTPVSALIHSSTMVTAGVFLVARCFPMFAHSEVALTTVGAIGAFTAIFAASMALVANDIKRVLAYCTVSQLGYMMLGLGAIGLVEFYGDHSEPVGIELAKGAAAIGIFHLFNHAFCKALLFLASGSVNHATGTFDMREMGGLRKHMPWTYLVYLIGTISMAGIWPLACFWSKDEIVAEAMELGGPRYILFILAMITVFMTAFYMFRTVFMTFHGEYRGGTASVHGHGHGGLHESPAVMLVPMFVLAALAIGSGWINVNGWFSSFFGEHVSHSWTHAFTLFTSHHGLPLISLIVALGGVAFAYMMYIRRQPSGEEVGRLLPTPYKVLSRKYWMDELYERVFVVRVLVDGVFWVLQWVDSNIVDGLVNGIAEGTIGSAGVIRQAQTGRLQAYGLVMFVGILVIAAFTYLFVK
ncbi:MAG: NADH-quinone oxidoreductase subunit L [Chloroflexi bacterium]|nr:MAG: NADH-quinone oxidoreductase subunit L [Chloroflexota bacterium]